MYKPTITCPKCCQSFPHDCAAEMGKRNAGKTSEAKRRAGAINLAKARAAKQGGKLCESCLASTPKCYTPAVRHSINPEYSGYDLCEECAKEYDSRI